MTSYSSTVTPYVGYLGSFNELEFKFQESEIDQVFAVPLEDLYDPLSRTEDDLRGFKVARFHKSPHPVSGIGQKVRY